ncbi:MAG: NAD(+) synthase [Myxococcales bacterium]|nr:NAD(+) synthase [Myxococcales bacterium]
MNRIRAAIAVLNQTPFAWDENRANIEAAIAEARRRGVTLLCLPELCITGYGCEDMFLASFVQDEAFRTLERLLPLTRGMIVSFGMPVLHRGCVYNTAALVVDGEIAGFVAKQFLAGDGIHYEPRWFKPWPTGRRATLEHGEQRYPIGDLTFDVGGVVLGFEICEDAWVARRPGASLSLQGVDVILNPSASHFAFGKQRIRRRLVLEGSRAFGVSYLYANLLGNEAGRAVYDGGGMIAAAGSLLTETMPFSFAGWGVYDAVLDIDHTRLIRAQSASFRPEVEGDERCVRVPFDHNAVPPKRHDIAPPPWVDGPHRKEEEFTRAIALALFDYMRKSHSQGFVISLSGGADSAACALLVYTAMQLAAAELGWEGFAERVGHLRSIGSAKSVDELMPRVLTTAYQATNNSGDVTRNAARAVAEAVHADHYELDVDALVKSYVTLLEGAVGRPLTWEQDDITLQNIQARTRGPSIWMFANLRSQLLLATSNRSEAAVGYATMDGDTCGGVSPIAGIDKAFLRQWLRFMESTGPHGLAPTPALAHINKQQPTAELRPKEAEQTDEGDLMPYPLLDAIEMVAIRDKKGPGDTFDLMRAEFPQYTPEQLRTWVVRFYRLWCRNQWKRERYAPSFHVDDKNLDPKTWCRFPILSGGYELELRELLARTL